MISYFKGFNGLRFFAAFAVLITHAFQSVKKQHFQLTEFTQHLPVFKKGGGAAVDFFFTLSGFLITYLLIKEIKKTGGVSIRKFYLRRVLRIWPLYFLILAIGLVLILWIYPKMSHKAYIDAQDVPYLVLYYLLFLPNLASSVFRVGVLFPLWSIGVEEQFYLIWAPLVKFLKSKIFTAALMLFSISLGIYLLRSFCVLTSETDKFLSTLRFNYMSVGAMFAVFVDRTGVENLKKQVLLTPVMRIVVPLLILAYFNLDTTFIDEFILSVFVSGLFGVLLLQVFTVKKPWLNLESKALNYLGNISYGIYMFHLTIDYVLRTAALKLKLHKLVQGELYLIIYTCSLLTITILAAHLSHKYFERFFLNIKHKFSTL